jgi:flagellar hook-basal body complex protein FliE
MSVAVAPMLPVSGLALSGLGTSALTYASMPTSTTVRLMHSAGKKSFADLLVDGVNQVEAKLQHADAMVSAFALDDSIPVHQVTFALEQARQSVELMVQVRNRLLEGYQQFMSMQA